ncbi:family 43 glycosylhydrolase [Microbacterium sp. NPDC089696]|uniref:glycoside hydrolase family 43 protein n=1 Tax=Microbacterium sp. NPDC089696 TaxID=3364199 RepID=UPI00382F936E
MHPVIPGFHPDPSICRVGDDYFLVNSSFEYAPGVPIFHSRDLVAWEQIGNVLDDPEHLVVQQGIGGASGGIYAPTLRHHDGRFWMITTNIHEVARGHLLVHADDPRGPWSEPVHVAGLIGIDPDIAWTDDGRCLVTWSDVMRGGIAQAEIDPFTGAVLSEPRSLWAGTGGAHAEGPHLVRHGDWWYLVVAEGGTGPGHMVTIARSSRPDGPFEQAPTNPILTHRSTGDPVQSTGHSDLIELADGSWALVFLATRPRGTFPRWHTNGRETFIAGVDWVDGWPTVDEQRHAAPASSTGFVDDFSTDALDPRWISPGRAPRTFAHPTAAGLALDAGRAPEDATALALLAARVEDERWSTTAEGSGDLALSVRIDDAHQVIVERVGSEIRVRVVIGPLDQVVARSRASVDSALIVRADEAVAERGARRGPDVIRAGFVDGGAETLLADVDGRYLSTEVAGGFTGRVIGIEALGDGVVVQRFAYQPLSEE